SDGYSSSTGDAPAKCIAIHKKECEVRDSCGEEPPFLCVGGGAIIEPFCSSWNRVHGFDKCMKAWSEMKCNPKGPVATPAVCQHNMN
ncbi:MAG: hypothetical protein FWD57_15080, partial [Polyangiaceae bacterium]|nr:hypothetical protein [Polyangiaceae bacterium]